MTKSELIEALAGKLKDFTKKDLEIVVNNVFSSMTDALARGDKVEIRGFGSFKVKNRRARQGRNPKTGEGIMIEPKKVPFFKVGKELKERVNNG